ncbi:protein timeless [Trichonephila clavata]|uniref:Protein timeless n=1 Tax=Trichonephila clavata TaxID=2740835 RepID=A0A8X6M1D4_TRICU|nr:protein timeless [Trichonephila clavata]
MSSLRAARAAERGRGVKDYKMNLTVMNFNRIRDLVSSLGWFGEDQMYIPGPDCLGTLENLEDELLNEDAVNRNVRISLHICGAVKKDLIPIISHGKDAKVVATATSPVSGALTHSQISST